MKGLLLLKSTLADMESKYGVHIFVKDMYSLMQTKPAFIDLLRQKNEFQSGTVRKRLFVYLSLRRQRILLPPPLFRLYHRCSGGRVLPL